MLQLNKTVPVTSIVAATLLTVGTTVGPAFAQKTAIEKPAVEKPKDKLAQGEEYVKHLLPLMDRDKNGKISKQDFMNFMEAEFKRLDKDKNGELDSKELTQSKSAPSSNSVSK